MKASDRGRNVKSKELFDETFRCFDEIVISMFNVTVAAKFSTHAKIKYTEL